MERPSRLFWAEIFIGCGVGMLSQVIKDWWPTAPLWLTPAMGYTAVALILLGLVQIRHEIIAVPAVGWQWLAARRLKVPWELRSARTLAIAEQETEWLLPSEAAERFALPSQIEVFGGHIQNYLHAELLAGRLIGRGRPHYGSAGDPLIPINRCEWQTLRLSGPGFYSAASIASIAQSYDNLEIARPMSTPNVTRKTSQP